MLQGMSDVTGSRAHQDMLDITQRPTSNESDGVWKTKQCIIYDVTSGLCDEQPILGMTLHGQLNKGSKQLDGRAEHATNSEYLR